MGLSAATSRCRQDSGRVANENVEVVRCYHERSEHPRRVRAHTPTSTGTTSRSSRRADLRRHRDCAGLGGESSAKGQPASSRASQKRGREPGRLRGTRSGRGHGGRRYGFASRTRSSGREVAPSSIQCLSRQMVGRSTPRAPTCVLVAGVQRVVPNMPGAAWRAISGSRWSAGPPTRGWVKGHRVDELPGESPALWAAGSAPGVVSGASAAASPWRRSPGSKTVVVNLA
jgi:hypothetical protein